VLVLAWIGFTGVLIAVGDVMAHSTTISHFDRHVTSWVVAHRVPSLDTAMKVLTWAGSWVMVTPGWCPSLWV
jgi:hypothetical protein